MSPKTKILLTILMWTFGGVTLKLISSSNLFTIMALGLFASSLANYLYLFNTGGFDRKVLSVKFVFFSMTGYFFYWLFFLHSIEAYGSNVSAPLVLNYTWPFFTGIFTILFYKREKFNSIFYLSSILGFCGVVILLLKGDFASFSIIDSVKGFAFGLLAGLSYGLFSAYSSSLTTDKEHSHYLFIGTFISFILLLAFSFYRYGSNTFDLSILDWTIALAEGLLLDFLGYYFWTSANKSAANNKTSISKIINLVNFLPLFSILSIAFIFNDERAIILEPYFVISFILVFSGVLLSNLKKS